MSELAEKPKIPDKLFFKIGEVAAIANTKPHVLRYWETEFGMLKPVKNASGQRVYRRRDVEMVLEIKRLLHEERFTIAGAKKRLAGRRGAKSRVLGVENRPASSAVQAPAEEPSNLLRELEKGLREILAVLDETDEKLKGV
ncbi:MAG: MerR family transcriptional regulator [Candidatus Tectomicrobia bacterium]|nr:MerR family transcriptional regulator [Candidatus Tectomicrobia bacterium]